MSGNKSGAVDTRWEILRCLYAGEASVLPLSAPEIALVANCTIEEAKRRVANWIIPGQSPIAKAREHITDYRKQGSNLARQTLEVISQELDNLQQLEPEESPPDAQLKILLGLTKSFQSLEEIINRMEKAIVDDDRYPSDVLEFRQELERYLKGLGNAEAAE